MGGGHHHLPKIPDYKIYKVEDVPELMTVKRALAAEGLKDPWLRNEVWRYLPENKDPPKVIWNKILLRGWKVGLGLAIITAIAETAWDKSREHLYHHDGEGHH